MLNPDAFVGLSVDDEIIQKAIVDSVGGYIFAIDGIIVDADESAEMLTLRNANLSTESLLIELKPREVLRYPQRKRDVYWIGDAKIFQDADE